MRYLMLLLLLGCAGEDPCSYERSKDGYVPSYGGSLFVPCDGNDPALSGSCEGGPTTVDKIETINTGRGHQYCWFYGEEGPVSATVVCSCD